MRKKTKNIVVTKEPYKTGGLRRNGTATTIYLGNLKYSKTEGQIKKIFTKYGKVNYVKLVVDKKTSLSKGIAFIQMPNKDDAKLAISELNGKVIDGRTVKVSIAIESEEIKKRVYKPKNKLESKEKTIKEDLPPRKRRRDKQKERGLGALFTYLSK